MAEPFVPSAAAAATSSHPPTEELMMDVGSSEVDNTQSSWKAEVFPEESLIPAPLSQDLFSSTAAAISPLVLNSELKATAAPFTMPPALGSFPVAAQPADPFDLLMDSENASLGNSSQVFSPENKAMSSDMVDSGMFDSPSSLQESCVQDVAEEDTSAFSPASQPSPGFSQKGDVVASAPPLSPSDASWLLNDSHMSSNSDLFDFTDMSSSGHPVVLGLSFDAPSPAPLRSPKTTAQELQTKEHKDDKSAQKQSKKSRSSSSSSSVKSPTSPGAKKFPPLASPATSPSSLHPSALRESQDPVLTLQLSPSFPALLIPWRTQLRPLHLPPPSKVFVLTL
ncbi:hypothetical protein INR49_006635 [Caranx melampygus]|nr:hypothetical protein INR49_006635 [Caranx melampygus]